MLFRIINHTHVLAHNKLAHEQNIVRTDMQTEREGGPGGGGEPRYTMYTRWKLTNCLILSVVADSVFVNSHHQHHSSAHHPRSPPK